MNKKIADAPKRGLQVWAVGLTRASPSLAHVLDFGLFSRPIAKRVWPRLLCMHKGPIVGWTSLYIFLNRKRSKAWSKSNFPYCRLDPGLVLIYGRQWFGQVSHEGNMYRLIPNQTDLIGLEISTRTLNKQVGFGLNS